MVYKKIKRRVKKVFKKKKKKKVSSKRLYTPAPTQSKVYGPVRYTPSKKKVYQGPVRPGRDVKTFRETGRSVKVFTPRPSRGGGSSRPTLGGRTSSAGVVLPTIDTFTPKVTTKTKSRGFDIKKYAQQKRGQDIRKRLDEVRKDRSLKERTKSNVIKVKGRVVSAYDYASGGNVAHSKLDKRQGSINFKVDRFNNRYGNLDNQQQFINNQVEQFNTRYSGQELSQEAFNKASKRQRELEKLQENINARYREADKQMKKLEKDQKSISDSREKLFTKYRGKEITGKVEPKFDIKNIKYVFARGRERPSKETFFSDKDLGYKAGTRGLEVRRDFSPYQRKRINKLENNLKKLQEKQRKASGLRRKQLEIKVKNKQKEIRDARTGTFVKGKFVQKRKVQAHTDPTVMAFFVPVPKYKIPSKPSGITFAGDYKIQGNKLITDLQFETGKGGVGVARSVTIQKGKDGFTIVGGRTGKIKMKFPSGKKVPKEIRTFFGKEGSRTVGKATPVETIGIQPSQAISSNPKLQAMLVKGRQKYKGKIQERGTMRVMRNNLKGMTQLSRGQLVTARGRKIRVLSRTYKAVTRASGKRFKGLQKIKYKIPDKTLDDVASISSIFTKGDINTIFGRTISPLLGTEANFLGVIRGTKNLKNFSAGEQEQIQVMLKKFVATTVKALAKADQTTLSKVDKIVLASKIATGTVPKGLSVISKTSGKSVLVSNLKAPTIRVTAKSQMIKQKPRIITKGVRTGTAIKPKTKQKTKQAVKPKTKQRQRQIQKTRPKTKQKTRQAQKVAQRQKVRQRVLQRQIQRQKQKGKTRLKTPTTLKPIKPLKFALKFKPKRGILIKKKKKKRGYNVYARPVKKKGQKKRKLIKVNRVPLSRIRAKDLRNYVVDTSLARTGRIKVTKGKPRKPLLNVPAGYSSGTKRKFRKYRIVKGRKVKLRRGKVIERRRRLLDTRQEKRKITLRRRIKQISPKRKIKKVRRTNKRRKK